jgi:hypothetical protein
MGLRSGEEKGKWQEAGEELCRIGNDRALRAVLLVQSADHDLIGPGKQAWVRVHGARGAQWPSVVTQIAQVEAKNVPPQLSSHAGGDVPTQQDPVSKAENPYQQHYLCAVRLHAVDNVLQPGALGRVRIDAGSQTLWWRLRRYMGTTFGVNL